MQTTNDEKSILRWGGLAGILGSIILIIVFGIVIVFVGEDPATLAEFPVRYPTIRVARTVENSLYMLSLVLWVIHFLALYRALRGSSPAPALFGSVVGILGLVLLMTGAIPHIATSRLADLYHAPGATAADQATVVLMWQAIWVTFEAFLIEGLILLPIAWILLGAAMVGSPAFGKGLGGMSLVIGIAGAIAAVVLVIDPRSLIAVVGIFGSIIFHFVIGWKVYRLAAL